MDIYELLGFSIGDGHIFYSEKHRKYKLELNGNVEEDYDYFIQIKDFLTKNVKSKPHMYILKDKKGKTLRLEIYNKRFIERLISLGLPPGHKTFSVEIPKGLPQNNLVNFK
jgi:hypothetical protein